MECFDDYVLDVERFLAECRRVLGPAGPVYLWGHSMGALIVLAYLSAGFGPEAGVRAAVISAPAFRVTTPIPLWKTLLARTLSRLAPSVAFASPVRPEDLSRDLDVGRAYVRDPLVHQVASPRLFTEMSGTASRLFANPLDYGVPTLFIHGAADRLIDPEGTRSYYERSPLASKALKLYEGARHEVHNDPAHAEAFRDAFAFFERHAAEVATAAGPARASTPA